MHELLIQHKCLEKINQRGKIWKLRKGVQSFLYATSCPDLIHIPIKLHEAVSNHYRIMVQTRMFRKN